MNTPTHLLVAAAVLARTGRPIANTAVVFGALLPDIYIYVLVFWSRLIKGVPEAEIWTRLYWQDPWQTASALFNSIPIYGALLATAIYARQTIIKLICLAALLHIALDMPVHHDDAHRHFWPLSHWKFRSPLSYWDTRYYATYVQFFEVALALLCIVVLWRRFEATWIRAVLLLALATYVAVPLYFSMVLGHEH